MNAKRLRILFLPLLCVYCCSGSGAIAQNGAEPDVRALVLRGNALMQSRHFPEALHAYEQALKQEPDNKIVKSNIVEVHNNWGIFYYSQRKYAQAFGEWQRCLELNPAHANAKRNLAILNQALAQQGLTLSEEETPPVTPPKPPLTENKVAPAGESNVQAVQPPVGGTEQIPKESPDSDTGVFGAVTLMTPVPKSEGATSAPPIPPPPPQPVQSNPEPEPSAAVLLPSKPQQSQASTWQEPKTSPLFPVMPQQFPQSTAQPGQQMPVQSVPPTQSTPPPAPVQTTVIPPVQPYTPGAGSWEDELAALEMKVYGRNQGDLKIYQRLEKLEKDSGGQVRSGSVRERIDYLKQNFGL